MRQLIRTIDRAIDAGLLLFFILIFLIGLYFSYDMWYVFNHATDDSLLRFKPTADQTTVDLGELSDKAIGWLTIEDTGIDYPIMQGEDNMEFLNLDPYGHFSLSGSIFLDARNSADFSDHYSLIYGHHMEYGVMFGALDKYLDRTFFEKHRDGVITTGSERRSFRIFAAMKTDASIRLIFDPSTADKEELLAYIRQHSVLFDEPSGGNILGLSTCADPATTDRWVVFGAF